MLTENHARPCRHDNLKLYMRLPLGLIFLLLFFASGTLASGQIFKTLHTFASYPDAANPHGSGVFDSNGNMFGTSEGGGANGVGAIWEISKAGVYSVVYSFVGPNDGEEPYGSVTFDALGNMYGTATYGGSFYWGTVWKMTPTGVLTVLYNFSNGTDGANPYGDVAIDASGNIYGTAANAGSGNGTVWEITASGSFKVLHTFNGLTDGSSPNNGPTLDASGNLYGTTYVGAAMGSGYGYGTIWEINSGGQFKVLHAFTGGADGGTPEWCVTLDANGNIFGTAGGGGANNNGTVWEINSSGTFSVVYTFTGGSDGGFPFAGVAFDAAGHMFGTAGRGGDFDKGTVWEMSNTGSFATLHSFNGTDGFFPEGTLTLDANGDLFGVASYNGIEFGNGAIFEMGAATPASVTITPGVVVGGTSTTGTVNMTTVVLTDTIVNLSSGDANAQVLASVTVPAGSNSANFNITTSPLYTASDVVKIYASSGGKSVNSPLGITLTSVVHYVSVAPNSVTGGNSTIGTVYLSAIAPFNVTIQLSSNSPSAQFPTNPVTILAGTSSANFTITTSPAYVVTPINISATLGLRTVSCGLLLGITDSVHSISASPSSVTGGGSSTGTVYLTTPAPTGGTVVTLSSNSPDLQVQSTVIVQQGQLFANFPITTTGVLNTETVSISATLGTKTVSCGFGIGASAVLHAVTISPSSIVGGTLTTGIVSLTGPAPLGGALVTLSSTDPSAQVQAIVLVPAGQTSATFTISTTSVAANTNPQITATLNGISKSCGLIVAAPQLSGFQVSQTTLIGGSSAVVTVTISGPAPVGGILISLGTSSPNATLQTPVLIPAGATTAHLTLATTVPSGFQIFTISATLGTKTDSITMTLQP